jgi:RHS repeat-associated protein
VGVGVQDSVSVQVSAAQAGVSYLLGLATDKIVSFSWDTTTVPDGVYELRAVFRLNASQVIGELSRTVLVNNSVVCHSGLVTTNQIWSAGQVHVVDGNLTIGKGVTVTIEPAAVVKFVHGAGITVADGGVLDAPATASGPIILTSLADDTAGGDSNLDGNNSLPVPGDWLGVTVQGTGQFNAAGAYLDLRYASRVHGGTLAGNETWPGTLLHLVNQNLVVPSSVTLTINPGAVVKFAAGVGMTIQSGGRLTALGTVALPITFTSLKDDSVGGDTNGDGGATQPAPGDWVGLNLSGQAVLDHCNITYGGNTGSGVGASGVIIVNATTVTISNSVVASTLWDGISVLGSANCAVVNCTLRDLDRAVWGYGGGHIELVNCTFDENLIGICNHVGTETIVAENCILANSIQASVNEGAITIRYCDIWSSYANSDNSLADIGHHGNFSADPKFKNSALGDYRLNYGSPCIDAADSTVAPPADFMGAPRYSDPRTVVKTGIASSTGAYADLGPYEFVETAASDLDLVVTQVSGPASVTAGDLVPVQWTVANLGSGLAVGPWHDTVYLAPAAGADAPLWAAEVLDGTLALGPGQTVTVTNSVRVPGGAEGNYRWQVRVNSRGEVYEGLNWTNNLASGAATVQLQVPELVVGANPVPHQFNAEGESQWFKVQLPAGQDVLVTLSSTNTSSELELYSGQGYMPTRLNYDGQQTASSGGAATLLLANGTGNAYYLLLYARSLPGGATGFSIEARAPVFSLTDVMGARLLGNTGPVTLHLRGGNLQETMTYQLVAPDGQILTSTAVQSPNSSEAFVTFNLSGRPVGAYGVRVVGNGQTVNLDNAVAVAAGQPGQVRVTVSSPKAIRPFRTGEVLLEYRNEGNSDALGPIIIVEGTNVKWIEDGRETSGGSRVLLGIAGEGPAGVLPPGARGSIVLPFRALNGNKCDFAAYLPPPDQPVNWSTLWPNLRPVDYPETTWNGALFTTFKARVGGDIGSLDRKLAAYATYLSGMGQRVSKLSDLLAGEVAMADGYGTIRRRNYFGRFGYGQDDPYDVRLRINDQNEAQVIVSGWPALTLPRQPDGSYADASGFPRIVVAGDGASLNRLDGTLMHFRADGMRDYIDVLNGNRLTFLYDGSRLAGWTNNLDNAIRFIYNAQGRVTAISNELGQATSLTYDSQAEHLVGIRTPDGLNWSFTYTNAPGTALAHAIVELSYPGGLRSRLAYDAQGLPRRVENADGTRWLEYLYPSSGLWVFTNQVNGVSSIACDHRGLPRRSVDPIGRVTEWSFDPTRHDVALRHSSGATMNCTFDALNRLSTVVDAGQRLYQAQYVESQDALSAFINARGVPTRFERDAHANLTAIHYVDGKSAEFRYGPRGEVISSKDPGGHAIQFTYDGRGRLQSKAYASGKRVEFAYGVLDNVTNIAEVVGNARRVTAISYDGSGRLVRVTNPAGRTVEYVYDAAGRRSRLRTSDGFEIIYDYDAEGRLARLSGPSGSAIVEYQYDVADRLISRRLAPGGATTYSYDQANQLLRVWNRAPDNSTLSEFNYQYDAAGRRVWVGMKASSLTVAYDSVGEVVSASNSVHGVTEYTYDPGGNRISQINNGLRLGYAVNALDQYSAIGQSTLTYDTAGNLTEWQRESETWSYTYDEDNRLVAATGPGGSWQFEYDALGYRVASVHNGNRTEYLLDPSGLGQVIGEYDGAGQLIAHYVHGIGLVSRLDDQGHSAYYYFDGQGSTSELVSKEGAVLNRYTYGVFGEAEDWQETTPNAFCFAGAWGVMHDGTGLDYMRARHYDPRLGRFIQRDPIGIDGGANLYAYAENNPVTGIDPTGTSDYYYYQWVDEIAARIFAASKGISLESASDMIKLMPSADKQIAVARELGISVDAMSKLQQTGVPANTAFEAIQGGVLQPTSLLRTAGGPVIVWFGVGGLAYAAGSYMEESSFTYISRAGVCVRTDASYHTGYYMVTNPERYERGLWLQSVGSSMLSVVYPSSWSYAWNYWFGGNGESSPASQSTTEVPRSADPNDITGPAGYGQQSYIKVDMTMYYLIQFENKTNASASAQVVVVTNQLPPNLDYTTFELGNMGFGTNVVTVPPGRTFYSSRVDARGTVGLYVDVQGQFDATNGVAVWTFTSIDPVTGGEPDDPFAGFLPPDISPPAGEGWVRYSVRPRADTADGSQINAQALVYFDTNPRLDTPTITNAVDSFSPSSSVTSLATTSPPNFTVSWTGQDGLGAGIVGYDIFVATNQAPYGCWLQGTTNTSAAFSGSVGSTYAFYSIASDGVGRRELPPMVADALTLVVASVSTNAPSLRAGPLMNVARMGHYIANMPDGSAVVFGGHGQGFVALNSIEIWRSAANSFTLVATPFTFDFGALVHLNDGRYLMAGGAANLGVAPGYNTAQLFDPAAGTVASTGTTMARPRMFCRGAVLANGKVLIVGGWYDTSSATYGEVFNPSTGSFAATGPLHTPRAQPVVLPTTDGKAVIAGGVGVYGSPSFIEPVELYDPAQNSFSVLANALFSGETGWALSPNGERTIQEQKTADGRYVLQASRVTNTVTEVVLAIFDPTARQFTKLAMNPAFREPVGAWTPVVSAAENAVYFLSGYNTNNSANLIFRVQRVDLATGQRVASGELAVTNYYPGSSATVLLKDGRLFVTGGTTAIDSQFNFKPVKNTFFVEGLPASSGAATAPRLSWSGVGKTLTLSWPASATGYLLQSTSNLAGAVTWNPVTNSVTVDGDQNTVTVDITSQGRFFRLKK